jgi:hypothetical protein
LNDVRHHVIKVIENFFFGDAHDVPSETAECTVTSGIRPSAVFVVRPIHFHDKSDLGGSEVHNPVSDDELPAEGEARLRA